MTSRQKLWNILKGIVNTKIFSHFNSLYHTAQFLFCYFITLVQMGILYVCVTHQEDSRFSVYQEKGLPSDESKQHFEVPSKIAEDVKNLRNKIKYKKGTEILLILPFVSDAMIRVVSMYPGVFYRDVTCSPNQQNRPLFLMVVKDANGLTYIGNISILPPKKRWDFQQNI